MKFSHTLAGAITLAISSAASAAPDTRYMAPPGLYQVELISVPGGATQQRGVPAAGGGSQRVCIKASEDASKELIAQGCKVDKGHVIDGRMVAMSSCPWGKARSSMRQVDARTWETTVEMAMQQGPGGAGGMAFIRTMAEKAAKSGNAQERAEAQKTLALFKELEAESKNQPQDELPPEAVAAMNSQGPASFDKKVVTRMTRVGDCKG